MADQSLEEKRSTFEEYIVRARGTHPSWGVDRLHEAARAWHARNHLPNGTFWFPWAPVSDAPTGGLPFVLLTGAGFSKGWGGFLVREMTARILSSSRLDRDPAIRLDLLKYNYEQVLALYRDRAQAVPTQASAYLAKEACLADAIKDAYSFQDTLQRRSSPSSPSLASMMSSLISPSLGQGFAYFTLNHDLLIERKWPEQQMGVHLELPGVTKESSRLAPDLGSIADFSEVGEIACKRNCCQYFKLHGSINWIEDASGVPSPVMVAGAAKYEQIAARQTAAGTLLRAYFKFFGEAIGRRTTVLIIGYSFSDEHINLVLARDGVRLALIDPGGLPTQFAGGDPIEMRIQRNLVGLWPNTYVDLFGVGGITNGNQPNLQDLKSCLGLRLA